MTTIALVRHGETDWNLERRLQGRADIPLNATGIEQAQALADVFDRDDWSLVFSSPLSRALATAQALSAGSGIPLAEPVDGLIERSFGQAEGATADDIAAKWADRIFPDAEPVEVVRARGYAIVHELVDRHEGNLVFVSHGAFIRAAVFALTGEDIGGIANGTVVRLERTNSAWALLPDPVAAVR
ncbi:broad specificity phosphatase PhoE [Mycetocola sp. CAN_C7]|uniref:histidine phosphatase family protein n=1 Tax=Mycetocola sp. CAN_C7 TaxID=2787724 RepID=UPI0018C98A27